MSQTSMADALAYDSSARWMAAWLWRVGYPVFRIGREFDHVSNATPPWIYLQGPAPETCFSNRLHKYLHRQRKLHYYLFLSAY